MLSSPPPTVTAGSLKLQGCPVFSSHYGKLAWGYIWTALSEKTNKQEVKLLTLSSQQLLLMLLDVTTEVPFYRARSWGVIRVNNFTYPSEEGVSVLSHMKSGSVFGHQLLLNLENPLATNKFFTLAWNEKVLVSKSIRAESPAHDCGRCGKADTFSLSLSA